MVVEVCAQPVLLEVGKPLGQVWEERCGRVVVVPALSRASNERCVAPVHVQPPHVDRQSSARPPTDVVLGLAFVIWVPPCEPRSESKVWQHGTRARQRDERSTCDLPVSEPAAEQEHVGVARYVVRKVVAVVRRVRAAGRCGRHAPARHVEPRGVDDRIGVGVDRPRAVKLLAARRVDDKRREVCGDVEEHHRIVAGDELCPLVGGTLRDRQARADCRAGGNHERRAVLETVRPLRLDAHEVGGDGGDPRGADDHRTRRH
eukprot:1062625-Prymnesium_polylepis.1